MLSGRLPHRPSSAMVASTIPPPRARCLSAAAGRRHGGRTTALLARAQGVDGGSCCGCRRTGHAGGIRAVLTWLLLVGLAWLRTREWPASRSCRQGSRSGKQRQSPPVHPEPARDAGPHTAGPPHRRRPSAPLALGEHHPARQPGRVRTAHQRPPPCPGRSATASWNCGGPVVSSPPPSPTATPACRASAGRSPSPNAAAGSPWSPTSATAGARTPPPAAKSSGSPSPPSRRRCAHCVRCRRRRP